MQVGKFEIKKTVTQLANELTVEDVNHAINEHQSGNTHINSVGNQLIRLVDAVSAALPHGNEAEKKCI